VRPRKKLTCQHCAREIGSLEPKETNATLIARALGVGPKHLSELAIAVYGHDSHDMRRRISASLKHNMTGLVEPVDGKGTWRLVGTTGRLHSVNDQVAEMFRMFT
jgi:hypothetical protein